MLISAYGQIVVGEPFLSHSWDFSDPADYQFDPEKIQIEDGIAKLKALPTDTGQALRLDGLSQQAHIADTDLSEISLGNDDFLFTAWVKTNGGDIFQGILEKKVFILGVSTGLRFHLELTGESYRLRSTLSTNLGSAREYIVNNAINDNDWHQVALAIDQTNDKLKFYLDGKPFGRVFDLNLPFGSTANNGTLVIGNSAGHFKGFIDEIYLRKFQGGLPENLDEIVRSHFDLDLIETQNIVSSWRFDDGTGNDSTGSNNLTLIDNPEIPASTIQRFPDNPQSFQSNCISSTDDALFSSMEAKGPGNKGDILHQLSIDEINWFYFDTEDGWILDIENSADNASPSFLIMENLPDFPWDSKILCMRTFFISNGLTPVELDNFSIIPAPANTVFINKPVTAKPATNGIHVIFETDLPSEAYIEYREYSPGKIIPWSTTTIVNGGTVFGVDVTGLSTNKFYEYRVRYRPRGTTTAFLVSNQGLVTTPPPEETPATFDFSVWGDSRPAGTNPAQPPEFTRLITSMAADKPVFIAAVGDNVNLTGAAPFSQETAFKLYEGWRDAYDMAGGNGYMFFGIGNHEGEALDEPFSSRARFARLRATAQPLNGNEKQEYYSWRWGDALFIMLNGSSDSIDVTQEAWLTALVQQPAKWKIVFNHFPFFNSDRRLGDTPQRDRLHDLFVDNKVQVVFQAHDHFYADTVLNGIHYTTSGGAGSPLRTATEFENLIIDFHYLRVEVSETGIGVSAIKVSGNGNNGDILEQYCIPDTGVDTGTDTDEDGMPDACDHDDDNDGIKDILEAGSDSTSARSASGLALPGGVTASVLTESGEKLTRVSSFVASESPSGINFPFGIISYITTSPVGGSVTVSVSFSSDLPESLVLYKVDQADNFITLPATIWNQVDARTINITLTDGDSLTDLDGSVNGSIEDPLAIGGVAATTGGGGATSSGGGGGGCTINANANADPVWLLLLLASGIGCIRRRWPGIQTSLPVTFYS